MIFIHIDVLGVDHDCYNICLIRETTLIQHDEISSKGVQSSYVCHYIVMAHSRHQICLEHVL